MDARKMIGMHQSRSDWCRRYYGRLSDPEAAMLHSEQTRLMRSWVDKGHPAANLEIGQRSMLALLYVLDKHHRASRATGRKARDVTPAEMDEVERARIAGALAQKPKRIPKKKQLLDRRWYPLVVKLRGEGMSWQVVSDYLRRHHRYSASGDYVRRACKEITQEREMRGDDMAGALKKLRFQEPRSGTIGGSTISILMKEVMRDGG